MIKAPGLLSDIMGWIRQFISVHDKNIAEFNALPFRLQANGVRLFAWASTIPLDLSISPENTFYSDGVNSNATINFTGIGNSGRRITIVMKNTTITNRTVTFGTGMIVSSSTITVNAGTQSTIDFVEVAGELKQTGRQASM